LSYIKIIRVLKSSTPNIYYVYLNFRNKEYANIFYNTFNYSKLNPIEKDYFILAEVKRLLFEKSENIGTIFLYLDLTFTPQRIQSLSPRATLLALNPSPIKTCNNNSLSKKLISNSDELGKYYQKDTFMLKE
jgi:hypothetical protein